MTTGNETLVLAHQGAWQDVSGPSAGNSIAALVAAVALGADGVEVDLQLTKDERAVLHHDATVSEEDVSAGCRAEKGTPLSELPSASLAHLADLGAALNALAAAADAAGRPVVCNLEVKTLPGEPGAEGHRCLLEKVATALSEPPVAGDGLLQVVVSCFALTYLEVLLEMRPSAVTGYLTGAGVDQMAAAKRAASAGCLALHPAYQGTDAGLVSFAAGLGMRVAPWTVDDPARAVELAGAGVWGIITNEPARLLAALRA